MAKQSKTLLLMASKLGLTEEEKVLSKAAEFERLLQTKSTASNIPDTAKTVICLSLAASYLRVDVDQKTAIKCSGLKGPTYTNSRKIIENLLELNDGLLTVSQLCLVLQCNVAELAEKILQEFRSRAKMNCVAFPQELDMSLPQYVCMAVYQACRLSKVKVSKSKLLDKSQLKPGQWSKLEAEWTKFTDEKFPMVKKRGRPAKNAVTEQEKMDIDSEIIEKEQDTVLEPQVENYEDWKRRILEVAYREVGKMQTNEQGRKHDNRPKQNENRNNENQNKQSENLSQKSENQNKHIENRSRKSENQKEHSENRSKKSENQNEHFENRNNQTDNQSKHQNRKPSETSINPVVLTFSPRRSPRETPQKYEPYASPVKSKGVRLLFPL